MLVVTVKLHKKSIAYKEIRILSTNNELRIKKGLLAVRQFLDIDLDTSINIKKEWSS